MHSKNSSADGSVFVDTLPPRREVGILKGGQRQLKVNILLLIPPRTLV